MTAKEKANELYEKFQQFDFVQELGWQPNKEETVKCALLCIDEMISTLKHEGITNGAHYFFLQQVKHELNSI